MKLQARHLPGHLARELASVYLVAGDEPLLVSEALQEIRARARADGFEERELHVVERAFKWKELEAGAENLSLFSSRRIIELRLPSPRPGDLGARTLRSLVERQKVGVLTVMHDLNLAAEYCDRIYLLREGEVAAEGPTAEVFTYQNLKRVYETEVYVDTNSLTGRLLVVPLSGRVQRKLQEGS